MLESTRVRLSMNVFRNVSKTNINWPELCGTKVCKVGTVGPDHKGSYGDKKKHTHLGVGIQAAKRNPVGKGWVDGEMS